MSTHDNLDNSTAGFYNDDWWRETYLMACRGAALFWRKRGIPEPKTDFRDSVRIWQSAGRRKKQHKQRMNDEQPE